MIMRRSSKSIFMTVGLTVVVAAAVAMAYLRSGSETWHIGKHTFKIPSEYIVETTVFFLPASQNRSLRFVINPTAQLQQQNMVSINPDATCPPTGRSQRADADCRIVPVPLFRLVHEKTRRVGDDVWWEYRFENGGELVAHCSALQDGEGLCSHFGLYEGLPYRVGLRDSQMRDLITLRKTIEQKMSEWEVR